MSGQWIIPDRLFDGQCLREGVGLQILDGKVVEIGPPPADAVRVAGLVTPGFVDVQVNGGGGVMLNSTPTRDGIGVIAAAHRRFGTVAVMPTVITDHPDVLDRAAEAAMAARDDRGVIGLHIEGPHISAARRGTHAEAYIRPLDDRTIEVVARLRAAGVTVMLTLAPEAAEIAQIATLAEMGTIVSIGHTDATADQVKAAIEAGARCGTHLFNAMSPMVGRAPGAVGAVINSDCFAGIICDGHHVADEMVALAIRARPAPGRMFLVSDAMATVGGPDAFTLYGRQITLKDGRLINAEGSLAGAHVTQADAVKRLATQTQTPLETALGMATSVPAACVGADGLGGVVGRDAGDLIVLNDTLDLVGSLAAMLGDPPVVDAAE